jgi:hypothetical protein
MGVSLAGVGVAVAVFGVIVWGGDYLAHGVHFSDESGFSISDSRRVLGIVLSLIVIAAGYLLAAARVSGPVTTAGVVASALGVPVLMGFITFSLNADGPFQLEAVVFVSIAVWVLSFAVVRGTRGHSFYLGLAALTFWFYVLDKAEPNALSITRAVSRSLGFGGGGGPDWSTVSGLSFAFGAVYYAVMVRLDLRGRAGIATPFALAGFVATTAGVAATAPDLHVKGVGAFLIGVGLIECALGARAARRFTTWVGAFEIGGGTVALIGDSINSNNTAAGIVLIVCGLAMVVAGHVWAVAFRERTDDVSLG